MGLEGIGVGSTSGITDSHHFHNFSWKGRACMDLVLCPKTGSYNGNFKFFTHASEISMVVKRIKFKSALQALIYPLIFKKESRFYWMVQ